MLDRLDKDKHGPQHQGHEADALELQDRIGPADGGLGKVWQDQRQRRQRPEHSEERGGALQLEGLLEVSPRPQDQAEADDAVEHDHYRREHRIARNHIGARGAGEHDRHDERGLDHRHRDREQDRAERLAELERQHFRVMDGGEHRLAEQDARKNEDVCRIGGDDMGEFQPQEPARDKRDRPGPDRDGGMVRRRHRSIRLQECASVQEKRPAGKPGRSRGVWPVAPA
jgi:hypothetical protein